MSEVISITVSATQREDGDWDAAFHAFSTSLRTGEEEHHGVRLEGVPAAEFGERVREQAHRVVEEALGKALEGPSEERG